MKKQLKVLMYALLAISMVVCSVVGVMRINVEQQYKDVQIAVRYADVLNIALQTGLSTEEVFEMLKEQGATTLFVRENTVSPSGRGEYYNYKEQGMANYYDGYELQRQYPEAATIKRQFIYIDTFSQETFDSIYTNLVAKDIPVGTLELGGKTFIELRSHPSTLTTVGVGFNQDDLKIAADLGYVISPQVKSWDNVSQAGVDLFVSELEALENLGPIYFADSDIVKLNVPEIQKLVAEHGLGFVEFFSNKQAGFGKMAKASSDAGKNFGVVRLHTLTDGEVRNYSKQQMMDRFMLALTERNLRVFLFKMPSTMNIEADMGALVDQMATFKALVESKGYTVTGEASRFNLPMGNYFMALIAGVGAVILFVLICDYLGYAKVGIVLAALGLVGYAGLLKLSPNFAVKMMALFGASVFPTYGVLYMFEAETTDLKQAILRFLKGSIISFGGALTIIGTLSRTSFALGIDVFAGVKLAHLLPIMFVIIIMVYKRHGFNYQYVHGLLQKNITYFAVAILAVLGVVVLIYTTRTGNSGSVSSLELQLRQLLDTVLGVRPRTKEFMIGHPIMLTLLYFGYQDKYIPFLVLGIIGQISLVNTYAHLHTPVVISLIRSGYGLVFGIIGGIVLIYIIKFLYKVINQWIAKNQ
ncbi:MAG: DUF5693 family protein [Cellulosilyticaceae bacterium]